MMYLWENSSAYSMMEAARFMLLPQRELIKLGNRWSGDQRNPFSDSKFAQKVAASYNLAERLTRTYDKPEFNITSTVVDEQIVNIVQRTVLKKSFCNLIHFKKSDGNLGQPKLLIVAPVSGHHATLLRGTVQAALQHFDVYITDWIDAKYVPVWKGGFDFDDYVDYVIEFLEFLGEGVNVMAVCQPTVPVLAAVSIMSDANNPCVPNSMILMGGPIDTRKNPTEVNNFALQKNIHWFESRLITRVPGDYPGFMRAVYPGFLQLSSFLMMNPKRHIQAHVDYYKALVEDNSEAAETHRKFYDEYLAVMDMPAEFYLQTIKLVFKEHQLPRGIMVSRGRKVNPAAITKTALLGIEGELDDISGVGQTEAALGLCKNILANKKHYHLQKNAGHYGVFSGRHFREEVMPLIKNFVYKINRLKK